MKKLFKNYLKNNDLKLSKQRMKILETVISTEKHVTVDELYKIVSQRYPEIGHTTVYRTVKLLVECGILRELKFDDGLTRYEHKYGHEHHDHLICERCGKYVEVVDDRIEKLQGEMAEKYGFSAKKHKLEIYGVCSDCG